MTLNTSFVSREKRREEKEYGKEEKKGVSLGWLTKEKGEKKKNLGVPHQKSFPPKLGRKGGREERKR